MESPKISNIGKYRVLEVLGKGGMGIVYKAVDPVIGRLVAIKVITAGLDKNPTSLKRFYREAQSTGKLQHQNIVIVHELGEQDGAPFLVMEFLEGESLQSIISSRRQMSLLDKLDLMIQACAGLQYAHEHNIIHRDIKPGNLMLLKNGMLKIVDFGIARIGNDTVTLPGQVLGSINYMSPEQFTGVVVDCRTDIFSTGVALYELLTYALPFQGKDISSTLLKITNEPPPPLRDFLEVYPPDLEFVLHKALAKSRDERYQTAEDFAFDLGQVQDQLKRELASEYLRVAEDLVARSELTKAREQVLQTLRMDRQNRSANDLLKEINRRIQLHERQEQVNQLRMHAERANASGDVDLAIKYIDEAAGLLPDDTELRELRSSLIEGKQRREKINEAIRRAESAQWSGELDEALSAIEQARSLGAPQEQTESLHAAITKAIDQRDRRVQVDGYLDEAQRKISSRRYTDAIEVLRKAEAIDPNGVAIKELLALAAKNREQERKRKELSQVTAEIQEALSRDEFRIACEKADKALEEFPGERGLLKLKSLAEKQREASDRRIFVDEQVSLSRSLLERHETQKALETLEAATKRFPNEPALISLLTAVRENLNQERNEQRKNDYVHRAKDALRLNDFEGAVQILEEARSGLDSSEIEDLLQFAKEEAAANKRREIIDASAQEANRLMSAGCYEDVIKLLECILQDIPDEELEITLADAQLRLGELNRRIKDAVEAGARLLNAGRVDQAVRYLQSQKDACGSSPEFQAIFDRATSEQTRLRAVEAAVRSARAALVARDFDAAATSVSQCRQSIGDHPDLARMTQEIEQQRRDAASGIVSKAITDMRVLMLGRSYEAAVSLHDEVASLLDLVPEEVRERYLEMHEDAVRHLERQRSMPEAARAGAPPRADADATEQQLEWNVPPTNERTVFHDPAVQSLSQTALNPNTVTGSPGLGATMQRAQQTATDPDETVVFRGGIQLETTARAPEFTTEPQSEPVEQARLKLEPVRTTDHRGRKTPVGLVLLAVVVLIAALAGWWWIHEKFAGATSVAVQTSPPGAAVQVMNSTCITPNCKLDLPPGTYKLVAKLRGYATRTESVQVEKGKAPPTVNLVLEALRPVLRVNANFTKAHVQLDDRDVGSLENGAVELKDVSSGEHRVKISGSDGDAEFSFTSAPAQAPIVKRPIKARNLAVLTVSTIGGTTHLDCNCAAPQQLSVNGQAQGELSDAGRDLGDLGDGVHELQLRTGDESRTASIKSADYPALDVFLNAERNAGTLVIDTDIGNADVFVNGKHYRSANGSLRIPLDANVYSVRIQKNGYQPVTQQGIQIRKNEEKRVAFQLTPLDNRAFAAIRGGVAGANISIDGKDVGVVGDDGLFYSEALEPGEHVIRMAKPGYQTRLIEASVEGGEILNLSGEQAKLLKLGEQPAATPGDKQSTSRADAKPKIP